MGRKLAKEAKKKKKRCVTDQPTNCSIDRPRDERTDGLTVRSTNGPSNQRTDKVANRIVCTRQKKKRNNGKTRWFFSHFHMGPPIKKFSFRTPHFISAATEGIFQLEREGEGRTRKPDRTNAKSKDNHLPSKKVWKRNAKVGLCNLLLVHYTDRELLLFF